LQKRLVVKAGKHEQIYTPIVVPVETAEADAALFDEKTGKAVACQASPGKVTFILDRLKPGEEKGYRLSVNEGEQQSGTRVRLKDTEGERVDVLVSGKLFTSYQYAEKWVRPFMHPVIGPTGKPVTRAYPVIEGVPGETQDHPHHKSFYVAWGDLNGSDNWSELEGRHGYQRHKRFISLTEGSVFGEIVAANEWLDNAGTKVLDEVRKIRIYATPARWRIVDLEVTFRTTTGPVKFGDTKEGGICSIRVASSMDEKAGAGVIKNSYGGTGEPETWGKRAHWCDYCGPVDGQTVGIAVFDTPGNFRYPTYWHVRSYGLMTANPFGISHFEKDESKDGSHTVEAGKDFVFRYRVMFHAGDTSKAKIADRFLNYIEPPAVELS